MGRGNAQKVAILNRKQMEQILMFMRLHDGVETVIILEQPGQAGIGCGMYARFYRKGTQTYQEIDITDVDTW
jgi:hypothetical protein